jgi:hypothetical protein
LLSASAIKTDGSQNGGKVATILFTSMFGLGDCGDEATPLGYFAVAQKIGDHALSAPCFTAAGSLVKSSRQTHRIAIQ